MSLFPYTTLFRSRNCFISQPTTPNPSSANRSPHDRVASNAPIYTIPSTAGRMSVKRSVASLANCGRSEEHTSELQSRQYLVCRLLLEKKKKAVGVGNAEAEYHGEVERELGRASSNGDLVRGAASASAHMEFQNGSARGVQAISLVAGS